MMDSSTQDERLERYRLMEKIHAEEYETHQHEIRSLILQPITSMVLKSDTEK